MRTPVVQIGTRMRTTYCGPIDRNPTAPPAVEKQQRADSYVVTMKARSWPVRKRETPGITNKLEGDTVCPGGGIMSGVNEAMPSPSNDNPRYYARPRKRIDNDEGAGNASDKLY